MPAVQCAPHKQVGYICFIQIANLYNYMTCLICAVHFILGAQTSLMRIHQYLSVVKQYAYAVNIKPA